MREEVIRVFNAMKSKGLLPILNCVKVEKGMACKTDMDRTVLYRGSDIDLEPGIYEAKKTVLVKASDFSADDYPIIRKGRDADLKGKFYIHRSNFEDVVETAMTFSDPKNTYRQMDKMLWQIQKGYLLVITSDGKRLYRGGAVIKNDVLEGSYIVPIDRGTMAVLKAVLQADRMGAGFSVDVYKDKIVFKSGWVEFITTLMDGKDFPNVDEPLEKKHVCKIYDISGCEKMVQYLMQFRGKDMYTQTLTLYKDRATLNGGSYNKHFLKGYDKTVEVRGKTMHPIVLQLGISIDGEKDVIAKYRFDYFVDVVKAFGDRLKLYVGGDAVTTFFVPPAVRGWF